MKTNYFTLLVTMSIVAGCAHHRDVRPGSEGVHRVRIKTDNQAEGSREAISQANHYCEQIGKQPAFVEEKNKYEGSMDEQSYKNAKTASKVAQSAGGMAWVLGGKNESGIGGVLGMGGAVANQALGEEYSVEMKFKCQ